MGEWRCPSCNSKNVCVIGRVGLRLKQDADNFETEPIDSNHDWDEDSHMWCNDCGAGGRAKNFYLER